MSAPTWAPVDEATADLLELIGEDEHPSVDWEWEAFKAILHAVATLHAGIVSPNAMRPKLGQIAPRRVGPFYRRACKERLIEWRGDYEVSDDRKGGNAGRPVRVYVALGGAS